MSIREVRRAQRFAQELLRSAQAEAGTRSGGLPGPVGGLPESLGLALLVVLLKQSKVYSSDEPCKADEATFFNMS